MIQSYLKERLREVLPDLRWSESRRSSDSDVGTVYYEGGGSPDEYDVPNRYPRYMVYISSPDWGYAEYAAEVAFQTLKELGDEKVSIAFEKDGRIVAEKDVWLWRTRMTGEPNDLGVENGVRDFSINFDVLLTEMKEEITHGT